MINSLLDNLLKLTLPDHNCVYAFSGLFNHIMDLPLLGGGSSRTLFMSQIYREECLFVPIQSQNYNSEI